MKAITLVLAFMLWGCSPLYRVPDSQLLSLTPEQITALKDAGRVVRACLQFGGPPASGTGTILILPATDDTTVVFGPDCHPVAK